MYNGQSTLYLSGVFYINNSSKLCGGVSGSECAFSTWNPNNELLTIVTDWHGGFAGTGNGILIDNNAQFQVASSPHTTSRSSAIRARTVRSSVAAAVRRLKHPASPPDSTTRWNLRSSRSLPAWR
jgi:hypothetical protein